MLIYFSFLRQCLVLRFIAQPFAPVPVAGGCTSEEPPFSTRSLRVVAYVNARLNIVNMHRRLSLRTFEHPFPSHGTTATDLIYLSTSTLMCQDDWAGWIEYTGSVADKVQTVGDDLTVTNIKRIKKAADEGACNALLLKVRRNTCTMT